MNKFLLAALVSTATLGLGACADNRPAGNSAYASADDDTISANVKAALSDDSHMLARHIQVATMNGQVELSGFTSSEEDKMNVEHIAMGVSGVTKVHNDVEVRPNGK